MLLSDLAILRAVEKAAIQIRPAFREQHLRPAGIRVHLAPEILVPVAGQLVDLAGGGEQEIEYARHDLLVEDYVLEPGCFVLGSTIEQLRTSPDIMCVLEGRSTIARIGLSIHNTASILDGAHSDWLTPVLEIANHGNIRVRLRTGAPIGMFCFQQLKGTMSPLRHGRQYAGQSGTTPPNLRLSARCETFESADVEHFNVHRR